MMVSGQASGLLRIAFVDDSEERELCAGNSLPPFPSRFEFGSAVRPGLQFYIQFENRGEAAVTVEYQVFARGYYAQASGCAPGCLLALAGFGTCIGALLL